MTPPLDDTGTQLLARPTGRDSSIEALVAMHDRDVRSALRRVLGRSQEEDDLVQEVFTRLVVRLRQPGDVVVGAWVRGVAHNLAVDEIRRRRPVPVDETHLDREVSCPADDRLEGAELYSRLVEGAQILPDRQRAALAASLSSGAPGVATVASSLGVSVHAAESLLSRARFNLRTHLAGAGTGGSEGDTGSMRVSLGTTMAVLAGVIGWLFRRWRSVAVATVATGALTSVAWVPMLQGPPPAAVGQSAGAVAGVTGSSGLEAPVDSAGEDGGAGDVEPDGASASGTPSTGAAETAAVATIPGRTETGGAVRLPLPGVVPGPVPLPDPCAPPTALVPAPELPSGAGDLVSPLADGALSPATDATPTASATCPALPPTPVS